MRRKKFFVLKEFIIVMVLGIIVYTGCVYHANRFRFINYYIENKKTETPAVVVLHGDIFSWVERVPEFIRQFMVHNFSPKDTSIAERVNEEVQKTHIFNYLALYFIGVMGYWNNAGMGRKRGDSQKNAF